MMSSVCGEADKQKLLSILWDSGRLNHSLCVSLVCDELLKKLSNAFNKEVETVEFWKKCFKSSLQSLTGVIQISSYFFSTVPHDSLDDKNVVHPFRDVKSAVEKLKLQPWSSESNFRRGYLLYYLGDKLISTGNFFEALSRAEDALQLRAELFVVSFSEIYKLLESEFICFETWCSHEMNWDGEGLYISPWKALQCYLESILQVGCINEVIGHGREAEHYFTLGKNISQKQNIPLFISSFSSALGNLEMKKKSWNRSLHELNNARGTLEKCEALSCENCCSMQRISIEMHLAHVSRKTYCNERKDVTFRGSCVAEHWYTSALSKLKSEWSDFPKNLQEVEDELKNCSVSSTQPDTISMGKPESLLDCISLKRKLVRRKLYLGILSGQAKLLEFSNRIDGAAENIMQRISVLRGSSPLTQPDSFSSLTSLLMLVAREYSEDPFAIERAYFLYSVCWFSLKNKKPSESRTTSCVRFVELKDAVTLLKKAFVLSREVPALLQKVSKLLSVICILPSKMNFSLPSHSQELSESHWAAYFHQASIGTNLMKKMLQKCSEQTGSTSEADTCRLLRFQLPHFHVSVSIM